MNILSINIRGIAGAAKASWVKDIRIFNKVSAIALQESKVGSVRISDLMGFWENRDFEFSSSATVGLPGGLIWIWDPKILRIDFVVQERSILILRGKLAGGGDRVNLVNVYAPQSTSAKSQLWMDISACINPLEGKWIIAGDFNAVRNPDERKNTSFKRVCAENFNSFIFENGLLEVLPNRHSDHCLALLEIVDLKYGPRPFRVFHSWIGKPGFEEAVEKFEPHEPPDVSLSAKFASIRARLKIWRDEFLLKEREIERLALSELESLEYEMETRNLTEEEEWILVENRRLVREVEIRRSSDLKQRARLKLAMDVDENSKFLHAVVNGRKASNSIHGLNVNGEWCTKPNSVKKHVLSFFRDKFREEYPVRPEMLCSNLKKISDSKSEMLTTVLSDSEIKDAVFGCGDDRLLVLTE
ncbi:uncharacterized protein LOC110907261 [Helianthus annuus]|uniref:uncharacterized protein LOC110907261 n=1 Tax=Helianthus annuus TaxID=4232 RepID=UPI000B8F11E7|nr:uncharacterized protein LOC110907261 [Helianthus annuus]